MQQAGESIMGRRLLLVALDFRRFGRTHGVRRGDHEVDVVTVGTLGRIHAFFLLHFLQLRNFYLVRRNFLGRVFLSKTEFFGGIFRGRRAVGSCKKLSRCEGKNVASGERLM
jgi:hypothetical protein